MLVACEQAPQQPATIDEQAPAPGDDAAPAEQPPAVDADAEADVKVNANADAVPFFAGLSKIEYQVDYDMTTNANGQKFSGKLRQFIKGKDLLRMDMTTQGIETRTFIKGDEFFSCNKAQGNWMCITIDMKDAKDNANEMRDQIAKDPAKYTYRKLPSRTIAGTVTSCWAVTVEQSDAEYCFSADGVPLYIKVDGKQDGATFTSEMTATSYSKSVAASDFTLPAEPGQGFDMGAYGDLAAQYR
jgi:hypothetical protein